MRKLLLIITVLALNLGLMAPAMAVDCTQNVLSAQDAIQCGVAGANGGSVGDPAKAATTVNGTLASVLNIFSLVVGFMAVIMIVIAGFRYITSGGAQDRVASAKNTIIYAVVGLIIVALSQLIVQFVLDRAGNPPPSCVNGQWDSGASKGKKC